MARRDSLGARRWEGEHEKLAAIGAGLALRCDADGLLEGNAKFDIFVALDGRHADDRCGEEPGIQVSAVVPQMNSAVPEKN